jgi:hypothetical protein
MTSYEPPVNALLTVGEPSFDKEWPDYPRTYGLGPEHGPELIRMATDPELNQGAPDTKEVWAPLHAWRTLGQLRAEAAVQPLLDHLHRTEDEFDDAAGDEIPQVFGKVGPPAIPLLAAFLADETRGRYARGSAAGGLVHVTWNFPEARAECVRVLADQMAKARREDRDFNGWLLADLLDLEAVEAAPAIEAAFAADAVEESIAGDWEHVQYELGLRDTPPEPKRYVDPGWIIPLPPLAPVGPTSREAKAKKKAKRKQADKSRKRNRKRK